jgi:hypothetical protein
MLSPFGPVVSHCRAKEEENRLLLWEVRHLENQLYLMQNDPDKKQLIAQLTKEVAVMRQRCPPTPHDGLRAGCC